MSLEGLDSVYCSSFTGPESLDSPIEFVLQKMLILMQAFPRLSEIDILHQNGCFFLRVCVCFCLVRCPEMNYVFPSLNHQKYFRGMCYYEEWSINY